MIKRGKAKGYQSLAEYVREVTEDGTLLIDHAMNVFLNRATSKDSRGTGPYSEEQKWRALEFLANRGFGRPVTTVDIQATVETRSLVASVNYQALSDAELDALEGFLNGEPLSLPAPNSKKK